MAPLKYQAVASVNCVGNRDGLINFNSSTHTCYYFQKLIATLGHFKLMYSVEWEFPMMIALIFHWILISSWLPFLLSPRNPNCCCNFIFSNTTESLSLSCVQFFCDPMDYHPPGSSVHGISQARILEWVAVSFSSAQTWVSCLAAGFFTIWATKESPQQREVPTSSAGDKFHLLWLL